MNLHGGLCYKISPPSDRRWRAVGRFLAAFYFERVPEHLSFPTRHLRFGPDDQIQMKYEDETLRTGETLRWIIWSDMSEMNPEVVQDRCNLLAIKR